MRVIEISKKTIHENLKNNIKYMGVIIVLNIALGIIVGTFNAILYNPQQNVNITALESELDLSLIDQDEAYFFNAFFKLKQKSQYLNAYLDYFTQVQLTSDSREKLNEVESELDLYDSERLSDAIRFYKNNPLALENQVESTICFYDDRIEIISDDKSNVYKKLNDVVEKNYTEDYKNEEQKKIESKIDSLDNEIGLYNNISNLLKTTDANTIQEKSVAAVELLKVNYSELNEIIQNFNKILKDISESENYEIIYNKRLISKYEKETTMKFYSEFTDEQIMNNTVNNAIIYAKSIEGLDVPKERFFSSIMFFALFGFVLAVFVGVIYKRKQYRWI